MNRRHILPGLAISAVAMALLANGVTAQQEKGKGGGGGKGPPQQQEPQKPMKEAIVGTWRLLVIDAIQADGTKVPLYGPNPRGMAVFTADGHYFVSNMRDSVPKFASNDRLKGTPAEIKAAYEGGLTQFGNYTLNEGDKSLTLRIEGSTFPNWTGTTQKRTITALTNDDLVWTNTGSAAPSLGGNRTDLVWRRMK